jgi:hypothetical protein
MHHSTAQPKPAVAPTRLVTFSRTARTAIVTASRAGKQQAVLLSWPAGAAYLPSEYYRPGEFDVVVGHIARCPVYVDVRRLALFRNQRLVVDAAPPTATRPHPPLRARAVPTSSGPAGQQPPGGPDSGDVVAELVADDVVDDLAADFAGLHPPQVVEAAVDGAISELRGSVSPEAMPEMATRLVRHRLAVNAPPERS